MVWLLGNVKLGKRCLLLRWKNLYIFVWFYCFVDGCGWKFYSGNSWWNKLEIWEKIYFCWFDGGGGEDRKFF